jgi:hypothetical protein
MRAQRLCINIRQEQRTEKATALFFNSGTSWFRHSRESGNPVKKSRSHTDHPNPNCLPLSTPASTLFSIS